MYKKKLINVTDAHLDKCKKLQGKYNVDNDSAVIRTLIERSRV